MPELSMYEPAGQTQVEEALTKLAVLLQLIHWLLFGPEQVWQF